MLFWSSQTKMEQDFPTIKTLLLNQRVHFWILSFDVFYTLGEHGSILNEPYRWKTLPADDKVIRENQIVNENCDLIMHVLRQVFEQCLANLLTWRKGLCMNKIVQDNLR
jgi:hypothetical protein